MFVVFLSSKYYEPLMADVPRWSKDHNQSALDGFSILYCDSASSTFLHGLSGRNMLNSFDMLVHASTTRKIICSFELSLFSCFLALVYQLIFRSSYASVFIDAYYSCGPSSHSVLNDLEKQTPVPHPYPGLGQRSCAPQIKLLIQLLFCSTLEYYIFYIEIVIGIAHHPMNSWYSDTSCHHCSFLGSCVIVTGMPTNESWHVKSILLATLLLGS